MPAVVQLKNDNVKHLYLKIQNDRYDFFVELIKNLNFVIIESDKAPAATKREKEKTVASIKKGFIDKKAIDEGKLKTFPIEDLFDE